MSAVPVSQQVIEPRTLRLFDSGDAEPSCSPNAAGAGDPRRALESAEGGQPTADELRSLIGRLTRLLPDEVEHRPDVSRLAEPGVNQPVVRPVEGTRAACSTASAVTLRACLDSDFCRNASCRQPVTWSGYRTLVKRWEAAWGGAGPDCRTLTGEQIQTAFMAVGDWSSHRSWEKNRNCLYALLQSSCQQTRKNVTGIAKPAVAPLSADDLPIWSLPPKDWFKTRPKPVKRHAGHRRSSLPLLEVADFDRVLAACEQTEDPLFWRVLLGWLWFCGMRIRDAVIALTWRETLEEDGVDLGNRLLHFEESKCGGSLDVPLPDWLCAGLRALKTREPHQLELFVGRPRFVFHRSPNWKNLSRWFYPAWHALWERAGVPCRMPHQMRGVCISWWIAEAEKYRKLVTGHSLGNDVQMKVYATFGEDFRRAAEKHPRPTLPL